MAVTYAITFITEHWVITYSDGRVIQLPTSTQVVQRQDDSVAFGETILLWQNCTSPVVTSAANLITSICALNKGIVVTQKDGLGISLGHVPNMSAVRKFGRNSDIDTATVPEDVWGYGGTYNFLTVATPIRIRAGGNIADTAAGSGSRELEIVGLDANFLEQTSTIVTAGASASAATAESYIRIFGAKVTKVGTYGGANVGIHHIETTGGTVIAHIDAGSSITEQLIYTIPAGKTGYLQHLHFSVSVSTGRSVTFKLLCRENADVITGDMSPETVVDTWDGISTHVDEDFPVPIVFPAKTDLWIRITSVDQNNTPVTAQVDLLLLDA